MDQSTIIELVKRSQNRDTAAFAELVGGTRRFAILTASRITGNPGEAADIVQEAYIRVWNNLPRFTGKVTFHTWFFSILRNLSIDWIRRDKSRRNRKYHEIPSADHDHPENLLVGSELNLLIKSWIQKLPETQQLVFILRDIDDLPIREVMIQTGLSEASIKSNLYIARKKLGAFLTRNGYQYR